jgi:hypothetical protein
MVLLIFSPVQLLPEILNAKHLTVFEKFQIFIGSIIAWGVTLMLNAIVIVLAAIFVPGFTIGYLMYRFLHKIFVVKKPPEEVPKE